VPLSWLYLVLICIPCTERVQGVNSNKYCEGVGFGHFYVQPPCNLLKTDYTEIFFMTDKGDIPSIECKISLKGPKSMRKVDGLNLH
jgi:hypothetical protein